MSLSMKCLSRAVWVFGLCAVFGLVQAEDAQDASYNTDASQLQKFTSDELANIVAPIALYPDSLLALVLPASEYPTQVVDAYRYTQSSATPTVPPDGTSWDSSVIALLNYPTALKKLNDDLPWTEQLGVAAAYQMDDLSQAIQQ